MGQGSDGALLSPGEVAARLGVDRRKVYRWIEDEQLEAVDVSIRGKGGRWRVSERALEKFLAQRSTQ